MAVTASVGVGQWDRRNRFLSIHFNKQCYICPNNTTFVCREIIVPNKTTAKPSEMGKYSTPELQAAFNTGREIGRTEGMLYYIKHASENMQKEAEKLNSKLQAQKAKV